MSELLPCPWCQTTRLHLDAFGTAGETDADLRPTDWRVMHDEGQEPKCEAWGPECDTREQALAAWNRRAPSAEEARLRAEVASLRATLGQQPAVEGAEPIGCPLPGACGAVRAHAAAYRAGAEAMRERAADKADAMADSWDADWRAERKASTHLEGKSDGAVEIAAAIRDLPLPAGGSGWQPIETAPRDQWLYVWNAEHRWLRIGRRFKGAGPRWYFSGQAGGAAQYGDGDEGPTHWQPLPAAPEEGG